VTRTDLTKVNFLPAALTLEVLEGAYSNIANLKQVNLTSASINRNHLIDAHQIGGILKNGKVCKSPTTDNCNL